MSEENLSIKAKEALRHIRNGLMRYGRVPSVRDLMHAMAYKSPRSAMLLMDELAKNGYLEQKDDGSYKLIKDLETENSSRTIAVPLVGTVACGIPILAEQNIEAMIPVSTNLARSGSKYFLLRASGNSMDKAGINDGDLLLVKQQPVADNGQNVVALIDDVATVKEFHHRGNVVTLIPRSTNPDHQQIIVQSDFQIQGIVEAVIYNGKLSCIKRQGNRKMEYPKRRW
ncbi:MAG: transcriptional repressor LexA [Ginsengibacter sp.]